MNSTLAKQRTVLITGATGGIGQAAVKAFAAQGDQVVIQYHTQAQTAIEMVNYYKGSGGKVLAVQADLTKSTEANALFEAAEGAFGSVDVLINCAGYSEQAQFQDITDTSWHQTMAVNLDSVFYCSRRAVPKMISRGGGVILNVSSIWGMTGGAMEVHYSTAKAAVIGLTKALAKELGPAHIKVNCLAPGWINTPMNAQHDEEAAAQFIQETPLGRLGTPEEIAAWMLFLCSEQASFMTGQVISPNGGVVI